MKFAIEVLQNRLDLLSKQQIGIEKCKCNKDVEKQIELKGKIYQLKEAIKILSEPITTIRINDICEAIGRIDKNGHHHLTSSV